MKLFKIYIALLVAILLITPSFSFAQSLADNKFMLAESYEQQGKYEDAARIYFELLKSNEDKLEFLAAWVRTTKKQGKYSELLEYLEVRYQKYKDFLTQLSLAEAYWMKGRANEANKLWEQMASSVNYQEEIIALAESQIALRQYQKAISLYQSARNKSNQPDLFSDELSRLYMLIGDYRNALNEILIELQYKPNLNKAEGRIYALMIDDDAKNFLKDELVKRNESNRNDINLFLLKIWFFSTIQDFDKALEYSIDLDKTFNKSFGEVLRFANATRYDGNYDIAIKAYTYIIDNAKKDNPNLPSALYGFAQTMERKLSQNKVIEPKELENIIAIYKKIIKDFPNNSIQYSAYYRLAEIIATYQKKYKEAIELLQKVDTRWGMDEVYFQANFKLSHYLLVINDIEKSIDINKSIIKKIPKNNTKLSEYEDLANYNIAKIYYYKGQFDSTKAYLAKIPMNSTSAIANDVLEFQSFLTQNENMIASIKNYAQAEFYELIQDTTNAFKYYRDAAKLGAGSDLEEKAISNIAKINYENDNFNNAISIYNEILDKFPNSINIDFYYFQIANSYLKLNNPNQAESTFTKIILNYPKSIYYEDARKEIRAIRELKNKQNQIN